jgi:hypothetical protein
VDTANALAKAKADLQREEEERRERERLAKLKAQAEFRRQHVDVHNAYDRVASINTRKLGVVMPFGKHKGTPISQLKSGSIEAYLDKSRFTLLPYLEEALRRELVARVQDPATPKQLGYLRWKKISHDAGITKKQAHALIEDHKASLEYQGAW